MRGSVLAVLTLLTVAPSARAQDRAMPADTPRPTITIPEGTRLQTVLEHGLTPRTSRPGSPIYLQLAHPLVVHDTVAMPAGTYLEGTLENVARKGHFRADLRLNLSRLVYGNGYVLATGTPAEGAAGEDVGEEDSPAAAAVLVGAGVVASGAFAIGAARAAARAGAPAPTLLGAAAPLGLLGLTLLGRRAVPLSFDEGTPVELVLSEPLVVDARRALAPGATAFLPVRRPTPRRESQCYSPGIPGTPDTVIPGIPGTPDIVIPGAPGAPDVVIPGTPGTPPTVIPGTPGTPGTWYPCPQ